MRFPLAAAGLIALAVAAPARAQTPAQHCAFNLAPPASASPVTSAEVCATIAALANDSMEGRRAGTEAADRAAAWIAARFDAGPHASVIEETRAELSLLARIAEDQLSVSDAPVANEQALTVVARDVVAYLPLAGMIDLEAERERLRKEIDAAKAEAERAQAMLGNESFVAKAPEKVVEVQRQRMAAANAQIEILTRRLDELG